MEMQKKQQWYQTNQINMSREDEQKYLEYCAEAMFRIHILELRLNRYLSILLWLLSLKNSVTDNLTRSEN